MGQGQVLHQPADRRRLGAVLFHEFQPGRGVVEEVPDQDGGALRGPGLLHLPGDAALQAQGRPGPVLPPPGADLHPADGGNRRQGLSPEAQGADLSQVLRPPELTGGVAEEGGGQLRRGDAAAVVRHPDEAHAPPADFHHHGGAVGVHGVFHQLLHHAGGALHHLPGGNEVRHVGGQLLDFRHGASSFPGSGRPVKAIPLPSMLINAYPFFPSLKRRNRQRDTLDYCPINRKLSKMIIAL